MTDGSGGASPGNSNNSAAGTNVDEYADGMYEDEDTARTNTGEARATTGGGDEEEDDDDEQEDMDESIDGTMN